MYPPPGGLILAEIREYSLTPPSTLGRQENSGPVMGRCARQERPRGGRSARLFWSPRLYCRRQAGRGEGFPLRQSVSVVLYLTPCLPYAYIRSGPFGADDEIVNSK
jgi:hypothetical protein